MSTSAIQALASMAHPRPPPGASRVASKSVPKSSHCRRRGSDNAVLRIPTSASGQYKALLATRLPSTTFVRGRPRGGSAMTKDKPVRHALAFA
eukprot:scaffold2865_cov356-Prasinococcus_capsulatus_cf.AAC.8